MSKFSDGRIHDRTDLRIVSYILITRTEQGRCVCMCVWEGKYGENKNFEIFAIKHFKLHVKPPPPYTHPKSDNHL